MKNNFEKFKEELTLDKAVELISESYDCELCPCKKECNANASDTPCRRFLRKWFNRTEDYEQIVLRANILGGMNSYIIELGDEDILETWLLDGVPDGCTEEELMEIAKDKTEFERITYLFGNLICHW